MGTRHPDRDMMSNLTSLEAYVKMIEKALSNDKTKVRKLLEMKEKVESFYFNFNQTYHLYKADIISKEKITEAQFNAKDTDTGEDNYENNDTWADNIFVKFIHITESLEDKIDELESSGTKASEEKPVAIENPDHIETEVVSEKNSLTQSITAYIQEVNDANKISITAASSMERFSEKLKARLEVLVLKGRKVGDVLRGEVNNFYDVQCTKLDAALLQICSKVEEATPPLTSPVAAPATGTSTPLPLYAGGAKEQVYLEKSKPPKFKGDVVDYPEFKRKWLSIVSKANLPEESEIDKLRDSLPSDANEQLYGVSTLAKAWSILDKRFGDPKIISMKLKNQLKSIKAEGQSNPARIISLSIKVRTIVTKLEAMKMSGALEHDSEFLAAVYRALPSIDQRRWLESEKTSNHWDDMMKFLERSYDMATEEIALLTTYKVDEKGKLETTKSPTKSFGANERKYQEPQQVHVRPLDNSYSDDDGEDPWEIDGNTFRSFAANVKVDKNDEKKEESPKEKARRRSLEFCGKCSICSKYHTWLRKDGENWPSDRFLSCKKFNDMTVAARAKVIENIKGCPRCTAWSHTRDKCKMPANNCGKVDISGVKCNGDHSKLLCGSGNAYCFAAKPVSTSVEEVKGKDDEFGAIDESADTVLYIQDIPVEGSTVKARTFWDEGSSRVLIREKFAEDLGLIKKKINYTLETVGSVEEKTGYLYLVNIVDMYGQSHRVWGYGIERIMSSSIPDMSHLKEIFPHVPRAAFKALEEKEVDILVGLNMNHLMPDGGTGVDMRDGIKVKRSKFDSGWVVGGVLPEVLPKPVRHSLSSQAALIRCARVKVIPQPAISPDFWEYDQLGVQPPPKCDRCRKCQTVGECSEGHAQHTLKAQAELDLIRANTKLINGEIWCDYPFIKDPSCLPDNRDAAIKVAEKVWRSLKKDNLLRGYNEQVQQILDRRAAVKLSKEEIDEYEGPYQYISHHPVLKSSVSTPVRMVTNSSFNNRGNSLNSCLAKGPNSLTPMLDVLLRCRCREVVMQYDLSKAYNTMRTGLKERHLRRFVWKFNEEEEWQDFAFDAVHFGDCCAATQLEVAKDLTADAGWNIDPEAAQRIKDDTYVDDGITGGTPAQVSRFIGKQRDDGSFDGTIPQILGKGNFKIKAMTFSGDSNQEQIDKLGGTMFGYSWNVPDDILSVRFPVNLSRKRRSVRSEPNLTITDIERLRTMHFCKRNLLGFVNGLTDPLGIGSPWYMKLKLLMKELYELENPLSWDDKIPEGSRDAWISVMTEALLEGVLNFPRSTRPPTAVGVGPVVAGFGDGALPGFGGDVYLQWQVACTHSEGCDGRGEGDFDANLCLSKARVCPLRGYTVPRSELCGALIVSRLLLSVVNALHKLEESPTKVIMCLDSRCIISALDMRSSKLLPFFQNRLAEINENLDSMAKICMVERVQWIHSDSNPADLLTRGTASIRDIGPGSLHQKGPNFLSSPWEDWPVTRSFVPQEIPKEETRSKEVIICASLRAAVSSDSSKIVIAETVESIAHYSNSINKVHRILARVLRGWGHKDMEKVITNPKALSIIAKEPTKDEIEVAKTFLLVHAMVATATAFHEGKLASLIPVRKGRLIVTTGRLGEKVMSKILGVSYLPILMPNTRVAFLYMYMAHQGESGLSSTAVEHHRSAVGTLARSRTYVWVVKGKNLAKQIVNLCQKCRKEKKRLESQQMGMLREAQLSVCPPWSYCSLDFAGPVKVAGEVQKRITLKCWILVYVCQSTRAVCLLLTSGYSTSDFLVKHEEFCSRKGIPHKILSDRGSQLVAGSISVAKKDMPDKAYDWNRVTRENSCSTWEFVPVGCQWRNQTEAMVKILKTALIHALPPGKELKYSEMVTLLSRIAFSINSRPLALANISPSSQQEDDLAPLTPNQLLLGHNTAEKPVMEYDVTDRYSARLAYIQSIHKEWWRRWIEDVLPTLIPVRKWKNQKRNIQVGDIVMMRYQGNLVDDYRIARVSKVFPSDRGIVRTVEVSFRRKGKDEGSRNYKSKPLSTEKVGVQRLALLQAVGEELPDGQ